MTDCDQRAANLKSGLLDLEPVVCDLERAARIAGRLSTECQESNLNEEELIEEICFAVDELRGRITAFKEQFYRVLEERVEKTEIAS
jgi:hypothetical protein